MTANPTDTLARFVADLDYRDIPPEVRTQVVALLLDSVACALLGRDGPETPRLENMSAALTGTGDSSVIGTSVRHSLAGATMVNAYQITALNLCDVYRPAHCHMSPVVVAPALSAAEKQHSSGEQLIAAVAAGLEAACRVGIALDFEQFRHNGWHSPGVIGPFGGATAVGRLYELDPDQMRNALGLAGSQAGGTMAHWGTPTIKFHQSRGAFSGLMAAVLARQDYQAGSDVIGQARGGILQVFSEGGSPARVTDGLGHDWELMKISLKRWPSGSGLATTVTSLFDLIDRHDLHPAHIDEVHLTLPEHAYSAHGEMGWDDRFGAMLSARFVTAVVLHDHRCWVEQFGDQRRADPDVVSFAKNQITVARDPDLPSEAATVEILMSDGSRIRDARRAPKGDPSDPLELADIEEKFRDAARSTDADPGLAEQLMALDEQEDISALLALLAR